MTIRDLCRIRLAGIALLALFLLPAATPSIAAPRERASKADKVSPALQWQLQMQERYSLERSDRAAEMLDALGIGVHDPFNSRCVIYVDEPLTEASMDQLAAQGAEVLAHTYTPAIPGRHPYGAYLANVEHSAFGMLRAITSVRRIDVAPRPLEAHNDVSSVVTNTSQVRRGHGVSKNTGAGVTIAVADTGIDLTHPDFPTPIEAFDVTDGDFPFEWGLDVSNTVSAHGTHVAGSALGRGTASGGSYPGSAPDADLAFYKIADDNSGSAFTADIVEAVYRAIEINCDIFSLSFGGLGNFNDGSEFLDQVFDYAYSQGMLCFTSAGNSADDDLHISVECPANGTSQPIRFLIENEGFSEPWEFFQFFQINWIDQIPGDANLTLELIITDDSAELEFAFSDFSFRGTEIYVSDFLFTVPADQDTIYEFVIRNDSDEPVTAQVFAIIGLDMSFVDADPSYTVGTPAVADTAIAVGSINHRPRYRNYMGAEYDYEDFLGEPLKASNFSSRGPRIDGVIKPDIAAPGAMMISCRDSVPGLAADPRFIIDNDNLNLDGSGPAQYYINAGTSMACPIAAGSAALLVEAHPYLDAEARRAAVIKNASQPDAPDYNVGFGIVSAKDSILYGPATGIAADLNGDFKVDVADLSILIAEFIGNDDLADINDDQTVDTADLGMLIRSLGTGVESAP